MGDIGKGDCVVCVDDRCDGNHHGVDPSLVTGRVYRVAKVVPGPFPNGCIGGLKVQGVVHSSRFGCCVARFRKIRPADPEFAALLKREPVEVL